jgi:hypothetical protein
MKSSKQVTDMTLCKLTEGKVPKVIPSAYAPKEKASMYNGDWIVHPQQFKEIKEEVEAALRLFNSKLYQVLK